jgi:hypothetical protein
VKAASPRRAVARTAPRSGRARRRLDELLPLYDFNEVHAIHVRSTPDRVFRAVQEVTPEEISFFRLLTAVRSLNPLRLLDRWTGGAGSPANRPILAASLDAGFVLLASEAGRELVIGTVGQFWKLSGGRGARLADDVAFARFARPGYAKVAMDFRIEEDAPGRCRLSTETRILATDSSARASFALYWRVIQPGSALIRSMWLRAIERRATTPA